MEELVIYKDFGNVPCGIKSVQTVQITNETNKPQTLAVDPKWRTLDVFSDKLQIHPLEVVAQPKQTVRFTLTYVSHVENVEDRFFLDIVDCEGIVALLNVHACSVGPSLSPTVFNLRFFYLRDVNQTSKIIEITNSAPQEAKFYFDLAEDHDQLEVSQRHGTIPGGHKFVLKFSFCPLQPGVYYKKIFCILQYHMPLIFNILAVYNPKVKLDPKSITFKYPPAEPESFSTYEEYMRKSKIGKLPEEEKASVFQKCLIYGSLNDKTESVNEEQRCAAPEDSLFLQNPMPDVFLTNTFVDIKNSPEVAKATTLVNSSKCHAYYFEWDYDPKGHFRILPCKGVIKPNAQTDFEIIFTPSAFDLLFHVELDTKIFLCNEDEPESNKSQIIYLPYTISLRVIGNSFPTDSNGWVPQCKILPKTLHLRACVPDEDVYGTFMIERSGHLPVHFAVLPSKEEHYTVHPPLGYMSKDFQLFVVKFNNDSKPPGVYEEDFKIKFNNSKLNIESIKLLTSVEKPCVVIRKDNSVIFKPVCPDSKVWTTVPIENPTNLHLCYEFHIPEDITWVDIVEPKGTISPKHFREIELIFQPDAPCEYLDYIPCFVSSVTREHYIETVYLQLIGSCQWGYLVATPSIYDFGECIFKSEKTVEIHLFNFSPVLLYFRLKPISKSCTTGDSERDVKIIPSRGIASPKGSVILEVTITPHEVGVFEYVILCQNFKDNSEDAEPCEGPRSIISLRFEGVLPSFQIIDLQVQNGGPLFSPHWCWQMLSIDKINKALLSSKSYQEVDIKLPEGITSQSPLIIAFLIKSDRHGDSVYNIHVNVKCPCFKESFADPDECYHSKSVSVYPAKRELGPNQTLVSHLRINYDAADDTAYVLELIFKLPFNRELILRMIQTTVPCYKSFASLYLLPTFPLKPVFIGDPQPPTQLFWLYNNTEEPVSYLVNTEALEKTFGCLNPEGIIQPFSPFPLAFVFSPTELKTYTADFPVSLGDQGPNRTIHLVGEGVLQVLPLQEFALKKTVPEKSLLNNDTIALVPYSNVIDIQFIRVFSQKKLFFFLENTSSANKWAFQWHSFSFENLFSVRVEPKMGVLKPGEKTLMSLIFQSGGYPTFVSFSIPGDVLDYTQLKARKEYLKQLEEAERTKKDHFTITEKGTTFEVKEVKPVSEPSKKNIFVTVNANILSSCTINQKLTKNQQSSLRAEKELQQDSTNDFGPLKMSALLPIQMLLEKLMWDILHNGKIGKTVRKLQRQQNFNYLQILPESKKKEDDNVRRLMMVPHKNFVQKYLDSTLKDILRKQFMFEKFDGNIGFSGNCQNS